MLHQQAIQNGTELYCRKKGLKWLLHTDSPFYKPSREYLKAKAILEIRSEFFKKNPSIKRTLAIPLSLSLEFQEFSNDKLEEQLVETREFLEKLQYDALRSDTTLEVVEQFRDCATSFKHSLEQLLIRLDGVPISFLKESRLMGVIGNDEHNGTNDDKSLKTSLSVKWNHLSELISVIQLVREHGVCLVGLTLKLGYSSRTGENEMETRHSFAQLLSDALTQPKQEQFHASIGTLIIKYIQAEPWQIEALFSAFGVLQVPIEKVYLSGGNFTEDRDRVRYWNFLADFSSCTFMQVWGLQHRERSRYTGSNCMYIQPNLILRQGPNLDLQPVEEVVEEPGYLPYDTRVKSVKYGNPRCANVVIPGYGECRVLRQDLLKGDKAETKLADTPLNSLSLGFETSGRDVEHLFQAVSWSLRHLSLKFTWNCDPNGVLPTLMQECPQLTSLTIQADFVDLDRFAEAYEQFGDNNSGSQGPVLTTLKFCRLRSFGEGNGVFLAQQLGDPASRLGKHLKELKISSNSYERPFHSRMLSVLWISLSRNSNLEKLTLVVSAPRNFTDRWISRFRQFNGQVVSSHTLPQSNKLALLSAVYPRKYSEYGGLPVLQHLDQHVLSLNFKFAATRVTRSVVTRRGH